MKYLSTVSAVALSMALFVPGVQAQDMPSPEQMWEIIQQQQKEIERLKAAVGQTTEKVTATEKKVEETQKQVAITDQKVEATGSALEQVVQEQAGGKQGTTLGGYAELHYNGGDKDQIDFHRFVLFLGHEFTDSIRFFSELELEPSLAGDDAPGEVELEQAYVEFDFNKNHRAAVGLQLIPVGILNETHEPPTFYGVERNNVEKNIIPTTWWEAGVRLSGNLGHDVTYDLMMHSGLETPTEGGNAFKIRNGRQKVAEADWKNSAFTGRLTWAGLPGVKVAASVQYQDDLTQGATDTSATLIEVHTDINRQVTANGSFGLRALFAQWDLSGDAPEAFGRDKQRGWFVEPSYKFSIGEQSAVGVFARYSVWDNEAGDEIDSAYKQTNIGINYWPHEDVVLKMDYQIDDFANEAKEDNRINLGIGLQF